MLIDSATPRIEMYRPDGQGWRVEMPAASEVLALESVGWRTSFEAVYEGVALPPLAALEEEAFFAASPSASR